MRILVVGDFSAGARRTAIEQRDLAKRGPLAVDVDSFEDAGDFARLVGGTPPAGAPEIEKSSAAAGYVQALIREAVAPHIVPDAPPHQALYAAADAAVGDAMRAVLQDPSAPPRRSWTPD